ncbi:chemotaxis protein CheW [Nocardioidaceae bacterium]|nr:chemotaxis protein CheW [Nocardioidaceae bacterium]
MDEDEEIVEEFLVESHEQLDQLDRDLVELERDPSSRELLSGIFRAIHTIKGTSGFLALTRLENLTHVGENLLSRLRDGQMELTPDIGEQLLRMVDTVRALLVQVEQHRTDADGVPEVDEVVAALQAALEGRTPPPATDLQRAEPLPELESQPEPRPEPRPESAPQPELQSDDPPPEVDPPGSVVDASIRVDVALLDDLVQLVGELVLTRNQILQRTSVTDDVELLRASQRLDLVASELQESVMRTRMQPIGQVWAKMPRVVRDLARQLGREVDLRLEGHDTELDRSLLEALKGPLAHLVRNALDHGIEPPSTREQLGKARTGRLLLRASHENGLVVIEISDDGAGLDPARIARTAVSRGVVGRDEADRMTDKELVELLFRPGFSTAAEVTNVSGRGVGMDVVRTNIERIGGTVDLTSETGRGTTCRVRIPLTLAIIPALVVAEAGERYAIPQSDLVELVRLEGGQDAPEVEQVAGAPVLHLRGDRLPLVRLADELGLPPTRPDALVVVVVEADGARFGLAVDDVHDTQEIVVKPIGRALKGLGTYAGATIMGDGRVSLILDVAGIAASHGLHGLHGLHADVAVTASTAAPQTLETSRSLLVLEVAGGRRAALPLAEVARLEDIAADTVEWTGDREVVQYRDGLLPLVRLATAIGLPDTSDGRDRLSLVVHEGDGTRVGLVFDQVVDVVESAAVPSSVGRRPGVTGSAVVADQVTDLVDLHDVVRAAEVVA